MDKINKVSFQIQELFNKDKNLKEVFNYIKRIPETTCGSPQPEFLYFLSRSLEKKGEILEIGTGAGKSLIALAYAQKQNDGKKVHSIDVLKLPNLKKTLSDVDILDWVILITGNSSDVVKTWNAPIELLWIDGDHLYKGVVADINNWSDFVIEGGLIAFHDFVYHTGVPSAVYEHILSKPWKWKVVSDREFGSIFVAQRICKKEIWIDQLIPRIIRGNSRFYIFETIRHLNIVLKKIGIRFNISKIIQKIKNLN